MLLFQLEIDKESLFTNHYKAAILVYMLNIIQNMSKILRKT